MSSRKRTRKITEQRAKAPTTLTTGLFTLGQVAEMLGCSVATVKRRVRSGMLPAFVDGRLVRVREVDLARYVAEHVMTRSPSGTVAAAGLPLPPGARLWD